MGRTILRRWWLIAAALLAGLVVWVAAQFIGNVPLPAAIPTAAQSSTVYADDGSTLALFHGTEDRIIVPLNQISTNLQQSVVAAEDRTFFTDSGFSLRGTLRALWVDIRGGSITQGGSTITQEYVRGVYAQIGNKRTVARKIKEAILAIKFARKYTKQEILSDYLNTVYFGRGAYGAQAAAEAYFNTSAANLTVSEAAYLAGILRSPEYYQPDSNPSGATRIRDTVLANMVDIKYLTQAQATAAKAQGLPFVGAGASNAARGAYFVEYVRRLLESQYKLSDSQVLTGGLKIYTTLDPKMQAAAENSVSSTLTAADDPQAAMVAMSTDGSIRALVGSRDVTNVQAAQGFNYAVQQASGAGRQAGSSFKPFTLATFIGAGYSIQSVFQAPTSIEVTSKQCQNLDGSNWSVTNYNNENFPDVNVTQATSNSVNTVYAQMVNLLGPKTVTAMARQIGGFTDLAPVCSITLGTSPATPLQMADAYVPFATQGQRPDPLAVLKVVTPTGQVLVNNAAHSTQVLDPNVANTVTQVLTQTLINGTASGKGIGRPAAGKTGTTENLVDAWFVGYTPSLSTAVWMGYPTNPTTHQTPAMTNVHGIQVTGGTLPATIWQRFMKAALAGTPSANFVAPTITGKIIGPTGAPCPAGQGPTADWQCLAPGAPCPVASPTSTAAPAAPSGTATPCPTPSEVLPPNIIIPSPTTTVTPAPKALAPAGTARGSPADVR
ncbi:MAG TPA: transglycosylase domain-containing protein [Actinomycetota bacterium]|nr:transglycosylase domain-containing protein [Actinomycetota bacterium]